jgi:Ca-activated chloride channel family protein
MALVPLMLLGYFLFRAWQKKAIRRFGSPVLLERLSPDGSVFKGWLKQSFLLLGFVFLIMALVNPKLGTELETIKREGVDLVFAIDVSKSMLAEDIAPNRLEKAKRLVSETINKLGGDRIGIIAYAASAVPHLPITTDYDAAKMFLQSLNTDMLSSQGTAISEAIRMAENYFDDANQANRVLCILSDGEDHEEGGLVAAETAAEAGITIFTIALGSEKGDVIPIKRNGVTSSFKKDDQGEVVITRMNTEILENVANATGGLFLRGDNTSQVVETIADALIQMDKQEFETKQFAKFKDQYQWFLAIGLLLICFEVFLLKRKTKWIQKLNLFNEK